MGGIRTFINYIYANWADPALELHILTPNIPEVDVLKNQLKNINCVWYATDQKDPGFQTFLKICYRIVKQNEFGLIHAHGFTSALAVSWMLPFVKSRSIFTSHDVLNESQFSGAKGKAKRIAMALLLNRFSVIHSVSYDAQENLQKNLPLINKDRCRVILNGVDTNRFFNATAVDIKSQMGIPQDTILIGFFGRFMSQKGFKYLVAAMADLEQRFPGKYRVACFGSGGFIREEKADLERRNLAHLFYMHDFVPDTAPYVKGCDVVAMPSLWEACGLVAMEVLTAGVPLVVSNCIGLREVCAGTPAVLVEPANSESLAAGLIEAGSAPREIFGEYAAIARDRYSVVDTQEQFFALYKQLVLKS